VNHRSGTARRPALEIIKPLSSRSCFSASSNRRVFKAGVVASRSERPQAGHLAFVIGSKLLDKSAVGLPAYRNLNPLHGARRATLSRGQGPALWSRNATPGGATDFSSQPRGLAALTNSVRSRRRG